MANDRMRAWLTRPGGLAAELVAARGALSMRNLADLLGDGWTSARISKLEHGQQLPTDKDLADIAVATQVGAEKRAVWQGLLDEAMSKRATFAKRRHTAATGPEHLALMLEADAGYIRATGPFVIPDLLQTAAYATDVAAASGVSPADAAQAVKELTERQRILSDLERAFQFVIPESALRTIPGSRSVLAGQLDRLVSAGSMSNVHIAVLPQMEPVEVLPLNGAIVIYDLDAVVDDGIEVRHYGGDEAALVVERVDRLWAAALRGDAARKRILAVAQELAAG